MVRVEVADQDGVKRPGVQEVGETRKGTLPQVQEDGRGVVPNEIGRSDGPGSIGVGRPGTDDVQIQPAVR
jgi:hypothetical protein